MMELWNRVKYWTGINRLANEKTAHSVYADTKFSLHKPGSAANAADLERNFAGLLLGVHSFVDMALNDFERKAIKELTALQSADLADTNLVPGLPTIVTDLLRLDRTDKSSGQALLKEINKDKILVGEVIRVANSPYYRGTEKLDSLDRVLAVQGHNGLRQIVAGIAMKPLFNLRRGHFGPLAGPRLLAQSERCAIASSCLAADQNIDAFDAYLAGFVSTTGYILGIRVLDQISGTQSPHSSAFREKWMLFGHKLSVKVAQHWHLPSPVIDALNDQVEIADTGHMGELGSVIYAGEKLSQIRLLIEAGHMDDSFGHFTCRLSGKLTDSCSKCYQQLLKLGT